MVVRTQWHISAHNDFSFYYLAIRCFLVFFSGRNRMMKHFGAKMQNSKPKLEARMAKTSTATAYFPGELT